MVSDDDENKTLDLARVTSLPHNMPELKRYPPTPPQFKVEVKIISNGSETDTDDKLVKTSGTHQSVGVLNSCSLSKQDDILGQRKQPIADHDTSDDFTTSL